MNSRTVVSLFASVVVLAWAKTSLAFEAVPFAEVPALVGKPVYAASNQRVGTALVFAGDDLTLVEAKPADGGFSYVKVKTKEGVVGEIQLRFLSKSALKYRLRSPGEPKAFLKALLDDAYPLGAKLHAMRIKYPDYIVPSEKVDEHHIEDATVESSSFAQKLLHNLVYGANLSKSDALREDRTKWLASANATLLDWFSDGMNKGPVKENFIDAVDALNALDAVSLHGFEAGQLVHEKAAKVWLRDLDDVPAAARAKIDREAVADIDKRMAEHKKQGTLALANAAKLRAKVK
jgi:hypothetical protein